MRTPAPVSTSLSGTLLFSTLAALSALAACGSAETSRVDSVSTPSASTVSPVRVAAPHGGALIELGNRAAYLEFVLDNTSVFMGFVPQLTGRERFRAIVQRVEVDGQVFTDIPLSYPPATHA